MNWPAIERHNSIPAPGGFGLVHDFLATASVGRPRQADLLFDLETANPWAASALHSWHDVQDVSEADPTPLTEGDLKQLRAFRGQLLDVVIGSAEAQALRGVPQIRQSVVLEFDPAGTVRIRPEGRGPLHLTGLLMSEIHRAQLLGTWRRLKVCRNAQCRGVFYDRSKNNSGVWHDVRSCGNVVTLRAARARKRATSA